MQSIGIYRIINRYNNKCYVGQSIHLGTRMKQHFSELKAGVHKNKRMQEDYNRHREYFNFEIIEYCELAELAAEEAYWCDYYHTFDKGYGYNQQPINKKRKYISDYKEKRIEENENRNRDKI